MRFRKFLLIILLTLSLVACGGKEKQEVSEAQNAATHSSGDFVVNEFKGDSLKIVGGSENKELEPLIRDFAEKNKINIEIDYIGSLEIMRMLQGGNIEYDAVWPASTLWITLGDTNHMLKHTEVTSITPVVFGIRKSLAKELDFIDKEVKISDIISAIESGKLSFAMTSASQSNSGASAYLGFLTAIADNPNGLSLEDLQNPQVQESITTLLGGVNRSSGSSNWLVDLFLNADYDAMVNYETLIIKTNNELVKQGKEPLHVIYPVDGLSFCDSPLAYVDKGDADKEAAFLKLQEFLLSDQGQDGIEKTGRRSAYGEVSQENRKVFKAEWGIDIDKVLSPIRLPKSEVIEEALVLYQSSFKKPSLTLYVLDFSGSMAGEGYAQLMASLEQVILPENAKKNLLLGTSKDMTYLIPFHEAIEACNYARGNGQELENLYNHSTTYQLGGGTSLYEALIYAIDILETYHSEELDNFTPAIVLLTDGRANGQAGIKNLARRYEAFGRDVPIFSITFGDADDVELKKIADLSKARVFDGRKDLIKAFQNVKGYN